MDLGSELRGRTLGIVGMGGIGSRLIQMLQPFGMKQAIAFDPYVGEKKAKEAIYDTSL